MASISAVQRSAFALGRWTLSVREFIIQPKIVLISSRRPSTIVLVLFKIGSLSTVSLRIGRKIASRIRGIVALIALSMYVLKPKHIIIMSLMKHSAERGFAFISTKSGRAIPNSPDRPPEVNLE